jgi:hypothetical protein
MLTAPIDIKAAVKSMPAWKSRLGTAISPVSEAAAMVSPADKSLPFTCFTLNHTPQISLVSIHTLI